MRTRTSPAEVRGMFKRCVRAAHAVGVDTTNWTLVEGDPFLGEAWRVFNDASGLEEIPAFASYLGRTAREASLALHAAARAYETVARARHLTVVD